MYVCVFAPMFTKRERPQKSNAVNYDGDVRLMTCCSYELPHEEHRLPTNGYKTHLEVGQVGVRLFFFTPSCL